MKKQVLVTLDFQRNFSAKSHLALLKIHAQY